LDGPIDGMDILEKRSSITLTGIRTLNRPARSLFATPIHNNKNVKTLLFLPLLTTLVAASVPPGQFCRVSGEAFVHMQRQ